MKSHTSHVDLRYLATKSASGNGFETRLSTEALAETQAVVKSAQTTIDREQRKDMTDLLWSSIDNTESRDLDQIEVIQALDGGEVRVLVGIADVDQFVPKGSALDRHAMNNTTSVYTGVVTFSMLPEELSCDITSLVQDKVRLSVVCDMVCTKDGGIKSKEFYRAKVENKAKLAYGPVGKWLSGEANAPSKDVYVNGLTEQLKSQSDEATRFHDMRVQHGSLNLYTIEAQPVMVDGKVVDIIATEDNPARELIENFMIAANMAMATFLDEHGFPSIRRVVREPKRWPRIVDLAKQYGFSLPDEPDGKALSEFLGRRKLADPEHFPDLSLSVVKLLGRGEYIVVEPGKATEGHFGLGIHDYTHSTAPNRRYADLVAQRLVKAIMDGKPCPYTVDELSEIAQRCTQMEDAANKTERFMRKAAAAVLLSEQIGDVFDAIVTGAKPDGVYVRLVKPPAEGRVVEGAANADVGDKIKVKLIDVDATKGFIDFKRVQ